MCKFGDFVLYFEVVKSSLLLHLQAPYSLFCASHVVESTLWGQTGHKPLACITLACQWYLPPGRVSYGMVDHAFEGRLALSFSTSSPCGIAPS